MSRLWKLDSIDEKPITTKDNKTLSQKQVKALCYNNFDLSKVSQMSYKYISELIGEFIEGYHMEHMPSIDDYEDWECPISPWGSDV